MVFSHEYLLEISKRAAEIKTAASPYQHNDFIKALIEQQKLVQQQEHEHKQKFQQEQQVNQFQLILKCRIYCLNRNKNVNVKN